MDINNITLVKNNITSCNYHRIRLPFSQMGIESKKNAPLCIFNRFPDFNLVTFRQMKKQGIRFIMDIDDSPFLNPHNPLYENSIKNYDIEREIELLRNVDMVWTTTERLRDILYMYNQNILVIPNSIPFGKDQFSDNTVPYEERNGTIYAGESSHQEDLSIISGISGITFAGYKENEYFKNIKKEFPEAKFIRHCNLDCYMDVYNGMEMSIAPLIYNSFNECKSNLKILEAGCKGIPVICSKIEPYLHDHVLMARSKIEFEYWISIMHKDKSRQIDCGKSLQDYVITNYNMPYINELRRQAIVSL